MSTKVAYERTGEIPRMVAKTIRLPFNQYEVAVAVSETGQILGIAEIKVRKDFRKPGQVGYVDVDDFYRE